MKITVKELAKRLKGEIVGDETLEVSALLDLNDLNDKTSKGSVVFSIDKKSQEKINSLTPYVLVTNEKVDSCQATQIIVDGKKDILIDLLNIFYPPDDKEYIAPEAAIAKSAKIGKNCKIYPGVVICDEVEIGNNVILYPNVAIYERCKIGNNVIIQANTTIGCDGFGYIQKEDGSSIKVPQKGITIIEDDVEIQANCMIDRGAVGATVIGKGTKIDNDCHIAHNTKVGKDCLLAACATIAGSCVLGDRVKFSGKVGMIDHLSIGDDATVLARSTVLTDLEGGKIYSGTPAREHSHNQKMLAILNKLPDVWNKIRQAIKDL